MRNRSIHALTSVALVLALGGSAHRGTEYKTLDDNGEPLKAVFNKDVGKVRILMLVAPT